jgi:uncharacterized lipoprotein
MNRIIAAFLISFFASGCALTVDKIDIPYEGKANITVVEGAKNVSVVVKGEDKRTVYKERVSTKKNGYGMEMASIEASNDLAKTFQFAVEFELQNMGFKVGPGGKNVLVELIRFYNDFKIGFFSGDAVADGLINVKVKDQQNQVIYSQAYEGGHIESNIMLASGENAQIALKGAMADIVAKIAHDKNLHKALLK